MVIQGPNGFESAPRLKQRASNTTLTILDLYLTAGGGRNLRGLNQRVLGPDTMAADRSLLNRPLSLRYRLPWLDGKMPGTFETPASSQSSRSSVVLEETHPAPLPQGADSSFLRRDPGVRAIGSEPMLPTSKRPSLDYRPYSAASHTQGRRDTPIAGSSNSDLKDSLVPKSASSDPWLAEGSLQDPLNLSRVVTDLENIVRGAMHVADDAVAQGRAEELSDILLEADDAVRRASVIPLSPRSPPLAPLDTDSGAGSEAGSETSQFPSDAEADAIVRSVDIEALPVSTSLQLPVERLSSEHGDLHIPSISGTPPNYYRVPPPDLDRHSSDDLPAIHNAELVAPLGTGAMSKNGPFEPGFSNPWAPRRRNTTLLDPEPVRQRRRPKRYDNVAPEDMYRPRGENRHYRNLDPATKGLSLKQRHHFSLRSNQGFSFGHHVRRHPNARKWTTSRKRITATIACINTGFVGFVIGVYAGEVPKIQYQVVDPHHYIILGNVMLFIGLAITTFIFWPLPLLHGRKPYTLGALALVLPLQFPQAVVVSSVRAPNDASFRVGLLLARLFTGFALGFANVNFIATLFDLFGASLQSANPHQELVILDDVRRQGGGMGIWLGLWSWCFLGSIGLGFLTGAGIIANLNPSWGFYITCIVGAAVLLLNVLAPETRRSPYRRSLAEFVDEDEKIRRRVARGEVKLHLEADGPIWWGEEVLAGLKLSFKMLSQWGFSVLALYLGWTYAQIVLVIVLLGSLLSREYHWRPHHVGLGVFSVAIGALFAVPLSKAGIFSRDRVRGPRTNSMTFEKQVTWSSHMVRRMIFMLVLPLVGIAYTLSSPGSSVHWFLPILFAAFIGFLSNLGLAECIGLVMETFDTSDLQPGVNSRHRLQSMASNVKRRRTNYSSFPRVTSGVFVSQTVGFLLAAAATGVGGVLTRSWGSQEATAVTAGVLMCLTALLTAVLWRLKRIQVVPNHAFGTRKNTRAGRGSTWGQYEDEYWKPVIIGNPSGKMRSMNILELGKMSRWTEIRKLNNLIKSGSGRSQQRNWTD